MAPPPHTWAARLCHVAATEHLCPANKTHDLFLHHCHKNGALMHVHILPAQTHSTQCNCRWCLGVVLVIHLGWYWGGIGWYWVVLAAIWRVINDMDVTSYFSQCAWDHSICWKTNNNGP